MDLSAGMHEPRRLDASELASSLADVCSQVAADQRPVIVERDGANVAAVVPLDYLDLARDALARQEAERVAATIDWKTAAQHHPPPQHWFEQDEPKPF